MRRFPALAAFAGLATAGGPAAAQFAIPAPRPRPDTVAYMDAVRDRFFRGLSQEQRSLVLASPISENPLESVRVTLCKAEPPSRQENCKVALDLTKWTRGTSVRPPRETKVHLPFRFPGFHGKGAISAYLKDNADSTGFRIFGSFAANVAEDQAFVTTQVISGLAGRALFSIGYASVVVKEKGDSTKAVRQTIEDSRATVLRMINNGGTLSARWLLPVHAQSGPTFQSISSVYATVGLIGPIGNGDSLRFAGSVTAELSTALSIRDLTEAASLLGELIMSGRIGYAWSESALLPGTKKRGLPYAQLAVGLRQGGSVGLSALVTWAMDKAYRPYTPRLTVSFTAVR